MWALATVKANSEPSVERALLRRGFTFHIFRYHSKIVRLGKVVQILKPLFPRYIFVPFALGWRICYDIDNVLGLVCFGDKVAEVPSDLVDSLVRQGVDDVLPIREAEAAASPKYRSGDRIIAIVGLLVGHAGTVLRPVPSTGKVRCEFDYSGKRIIADLPPLELRLVQRAPVVKRKRKRYRKSSPEDVVLAA